MRRARESASKPLPALASFCSSNSNRTATEQQATSIANQRRRAVGNLPSAMRSRTAARAGHQDFRLRNRARRCHVLQLAESQSVIWCHAAWWLPVTCVGPLKRGRRRAMRRGSLTAFPLSLILQSGKVIQCFVCFSNATRRINEPTKQPGGGKTQAHRAKL